METCSEARLPTATYEILSGSLRLRLRTDDRVRPVAFSYPQKIIHIYLFPRDPMALLVSVLYHHLSLTVPVEFCMHDNTSLYA